MGASGSYENHYAFKQNNTVIMKHQLGKYLRVNPANTDEADPDGEQNDHSEFEIDLQNNGERCRLKSVKSKKYLRIINGGNNINIAGNGGKFTIFRIHKQQSPGSCKLESIEFKGKYLAIGRQNKVRVGVGGKWCEVTLYRKS
eukprot:105178_1